MAMIRWIGAEAMLQRIMLAALSLLIIAAAVPVVSEDQAHPVEHPYDTQADAHAEVEAALAEARTSGRRVLLDFGGNWCADCRVLSGVLESPAVKPWLAANFVTVLIDIGRLSKNLDIAGRWGVQVQDAPAVLVISPDGRLLNRNALSALTDARLLSPQAVVDVLNTYLAVK
jgi:thiol:disulfide interchange protein